jgi:hypothetical protein
VRQLAGNGLKRCAKGLREKLAAEYELIAVGLRSHTGKATSAAWTQRQQLP